MVIRNKQEEVKCEKLEEECSDLIEMIKNAIRKLMQEQSQYESTSEDYMVLEHRIVEYTEALMNMEIAEKHAKERRLAELDIVKIKNDIARNYIMELLDEKT